MENTENIFY